MGETILWKGAQPVLPVVSEQERNKSRKRMGESHVFSEIAVENSSPVAASFSSCLCARDFPSGTQKPSMASLTNMTDRQIRFTWQTSDSFSDSCGNLCIIKEVKKCKNKYINKNSWGKNLKQFCLLWPNKYWYSIRHHSAHCCWTESNYAQSQCVSAPRRARMRCKDRSCFNRRCQKLNIRFLYTHRN